VGGQVKDPRRIPSDPHGGIKSPARGGAAALMDRSLC